MFTGNYDKRMARINRALIRAHTVGNINRAEVLESVYYRLWFAYRKEWQLSW
jgi:hypothetical protein